MKKNNIIYADPPWKYSSKQLYGDKINGYKNGEQKRFASIGKIYPTMTIADIKIFRLKTIQPMIVLVLCG